MIFLHTEGWITTTVVFLLIHPVIRGIPVPDGPVGLPSSIKVRPERNPRATKNHGHVHHPMVFVPPPELEKVVTKDIAKTENLLKHMQHQYQEDKLEGILKPIVEEAPMSLEKLLPLYYRSLPSNMASAKRYISDTAGALIKLGLQNLFKTNIFSKVACSPESNEADLVVCVTDDVNRVSQLINTCSSILALNYRVLAGGNTAKNALVRLLTLAANPLNKKLMIALGSTAAMYVTMLRESVPDDVKVLAGSIMTELTSMPVVSNIPDVASGGFGRVNVVIPRPSRVNRADYDIAKLKAGATERDLLVVNM